MAKEVKKRPKKAAVSTGRVRKLTKKQTRAKAKKTVKTRAPLPNVFKLSAQSFAVIKQFWHPLGGIVLVYLLLNVVFASGINNISSVFTNIKTDLQTNGGHNLTHAASGFASLVGSSGASGSGTASALQSILFVVESLVIIWALRHLLSSQKITVKQAYYSAMTPLIPFLLVIAVIIIQLLPLSIGAAVLSTIANSIFPSSGAATIISFVAFVLLAAWSVYMISSSIFSLYIVTLPEMQPRPALRAAKDLVSFRRFAIIRKTLFLPVIIFVVMGAIIVPLILYAQAIVPAVFYILAMLAILFAHTYLYGLYRDMLE